MRSSGPTHAALAFDALGSEIPSHTPHSMDHDKSTIGATRRHPDGLSWRVGANGGNRDAHAGGRSECTQLPLLVLQIRREHLLLASFPPFAEEALITPIVDLSYSILLAALRAKPDRMGPLSVQRLGQVGRGWINYR
jgi:hypothetical protein